MNRLVDGVLPAQRALVAKEHVSRCRRCRDAVNFISELREAAGDLYYPAPPPEILENVLAARAAGHRAILPQAPVIRPRRSLRPALVLSSLLALLAVSGLLLVSSEAEAGSSQLLFDPARPTDEELIRVEYHPGALLAAEELVVLRALGRDEGDGPPASGLARQRVLGQEYSTVLTPTGRGSFEGSVLLPPGMVYAALVVEDTSGTLIDANAGSLWHLLRRRGDGEPKSEALYQQYYAAGWLRPEFAAEQFAEMVRLNGDSPKAWAMQLEYEKETAGPTSEHILAKHRAQFLRLRDLISSPEPSENQLAGLTRYARALNNTIVFAQLDSVLQLMFPLNQEAVFNREIRVLGTAGKDLRRLLQFAENEWQSGAASDALVLNAWRNTRLFGSDEQMRVWADRYAERNPLRSAYVAMKLSERPSLRSLGIGRLRHEIEYLTDGYYDSARPLTTAFDEYARIIMNEIRLARTALGSALIASGDTTAGLEAIRLATATGWDVDLFKEALAVEIAFGDSTHAIEHLARLAIDPLVDSAVSRPNELGFDVHRLSWEAALSKARSEFHERVFEALPESRPIPAILVTDGHGQDVSLNDRLRGKVSIIATWSDLNELLSDVDEMSGSVSLLGTEGIQVLGVLEEPVRPLSILENQEVAESLLFSPSRQASTALGRWSTRSLFVVDERGRIRSNPRTWEEAIRHALVINHRRKLAA